MPYVKCPSCGERGKIAPTLVGARIKCRRCSVSFLVSPAAAKAPAGPGAALPSAAVEAPDGIAVEGLDDPAPVGAPLRTDAGVSSLAPTPLPTMPTTGSSQAQPKNLPEVSALIASTASVPSAAHPNSRRAGLIIAASARATWAKPRTIKKRPNGRYSSRWSGTTASSARRGCESESATTRSGRGPDRRTCCRDAASERPLVPAARQAARG